GPVLTIVPFPVMSLANQDCDAAAGTLSVKVELPSAMVDAVEPLIIPAQVSSKPFRSQVPAEGRTKLASGMTLDAPFFSVIPPPTITPAENVFAGLFKKTVFGLPEPRRNETVTVE